MPSETPPEPRDEKQIKTEEPLFLKEEPVAALVTSSSEPIKMNESVTNSTLTTE